MSITDPNASQVSGYLNNVPASPMGLQYLQKLSQGSNPEVPPIYALAALQQKQKEAQQAQMMQGAPQGAMPTVAQQVTQQAAATAAQEAARRQAMAQAYGDQSSAGETESADNMEPAAAKKGGIMALASGGGIPCAAQRQQQLSDLIGTVQSQQAQDAQGLQNAQAQVAAPQVAAAQTPTPMQGQNYMSTAAGTHPLYRSQTAPQAGVQTLAQQHMYGQGSEPDYNPYTATAAPTTATTTKAAKGGIIGLHTKPETLKFSKGGILHFDGEDGSQVPAAPNP